MHVETSALSGTTERVDPGQIGVDILVYVLFLRDTNPKRLEFLCFHSEGF